MKAMFCGVSDEARFIYGNIYEVLGKSEDLYYIIDESGEEYLYSLQNFCLIEENNDKVN